ncbi:FadR/GntR family transcriptional regulator [Agrococcus sp. Marseille-P2731]|uniref:FadR/GntR family transcriptional regulator n=1 Tax=Agrococcus sp. Marseille-P2731 TaxID=1841862 RepID=UPI000930D452|nr:FCD domain-containing protein [Agrococcus sp. Marseille-P2731]
MAGIRSKIAPGGAVSEHHFVTQLLNDNAFSELLELFGDIEPGTRLPSERELAQQLGVSRTALRDRIGQLVSLGVLERREREGTFFSGIKPEAVSDVLVLAMLSEQMTIESLVSVRTALERQAAIDACATTDAEALEQLGVAVRRMHESDDGFELFEADNAFHRAIFAASGSQGLVFFSRMLHAVLRGTLQQVSLSNDRVVLRERHQAIYDAILARDVEAAVRAMDLHFDWLKELRAAEGGGER